MTKTILLTLLGAIESELKKIGEWTSDRSIDLDWHLPFSEYLQYVGIPDQRMVLEKGERPDWQLGWYDSARVEWVRNPKFKETTEAIVNYLNALIEEYGADHKPYEIFQFFKLLTPQESMAGQELVKDILRSVPQVGELLPEHVETLKYIEYVLKNHLQQLERNEVPPILQDSAAFYFSTVEFSAHTVPIETAILKYQSWLAANKDNERTKSKLSEGKIQIDMEIPPTEVSRVINDVCAELSKGVKFRGYKLGETPLEVLKSDSNFRKRSFDIARERLVKTEFEKKIIEPWPKMKGKTFHDVLAEFQPLNRIDEKTSFKFRVTYQDSLIEK